MIEFLFRFLVAPHIPTCLKNLYSTHEDVEVGRCVQKFAGIPCTWNFEVSLELQFHSIIALIRVLFPDAIDIAPQRQWKNGLYW